MNEIAHRSHGLVTWRQLVAVVISCAGALSGLVAFAMVSHASRPHEGAVQVDRYVHDLDGHRDQIQRIEDKIDRISELLFSTRGASP